MKTIVPCFLAALLATSAFAVRAPSPAASAFDARNGAGSGLRRPTTDFTHLRTALQAKASAARRTKLLKAAVAVPKRWDSREQGWVTSVKNQGAYGTCWAFSTLAALETAYLKATGGAVTNDFSENHMATHDVGFGFGFSAGGNNQVAAALLASWRDPLLEREDPYPHPNSKTNAPPQCHVQDIVWLPERFCLFFTATEHYAVDAKTDNSAVDEAYKRAVMEYGAVAVGYYHSWNSYNPSTAAHYLSSSNYSGSASDGGHAVTLIGWDDDYPAANFRTGKQPPGNGAFLCKNSWGHSSDTTNGCTWISYYDEAIFDLPGAAYPLPEARTNYGRVYEYDPCGQVGSWNSADKESETVAENWCANVFTSLATGIVEAVGFYAMSADTAYTLRVYRGCASTPVDGELLVEQSGVVANAGYATLRFATPVPLETAGTKFSVVLKLACPDYDFPLPVECTHYEPDGQGGMVLWSSCTANAGESFISKNGRDWRDFQDYDKTANFCVKAYTRFGSDGDARKLIVDGSPAETALAVRVGEPQTFSVTPTDEAQGEDLAYEWRVNGIPSDCNAPVFVFTPTFAQRGNCAVECLVQSGGAADVRVWSLSVNADLHVAAGSAAAEPDGSPERPFATVADACVAAIEGDTVLVGPGVYYGTLEGPSVQIEIRSTHGPEATVLDADGSGRCFLASQNDEVVLSGFTLRNADAGDYLGGGVFGGVITNCVISNCVAAAGGGACRATLHDCRVVDCWAAYYGGGICDTVAEGCVIFGNVAYSSGGGAGGYDVGCELRHCTVFGNQAGNGGGADEYCSCQDTIVWGNYDGDWNVSNWSKVGSYWKTYATWFSQSCTCPLGFADGGGNVTNDPQFVSLEGADWRLRAGSPCLGTASDGGNRGAWQGEGLVGHVITTEVVGRGEVSPVSAFVLDGESATFVATGDHPFLFVETNGVRAAETREFTWNDVRADGTLTACFGATNYFVDASGGDDANDGLTERTARRSLQSTVDRTWMGDVVRVKPGVYGGLDVAYPGVTISSTDGAEKTVISTNAYRECFYTPYLDVSLVGFTLRDACIVGENGHGAGAYGGVLADCVISNCTASFGGGAAFAVLTNCLVVGNRAEAYQAYRRKDGGMGGGVFNCQLFNCTVAANSAARLGGGAYLDSGCVACNTIVATNVCDLGFANGNDIYGMGYYETICSLSDQDAKFADAARGDWRLSARSPCIDAGDNARIAADRDLGGASRIVGARVDMGCYEFCQTVPGWPTPAVKPGATAAEEARAVAAAMTAAGFTGEKASALSSAAQYAALSDWTASRGLDVAALAASPTAFVSAAFDAPGLLDLSAADLQTMGFAPAADGIGWKLTLAMEAYDPARVNPALLKAAVGVVGSETPTGGYSADGLSVSATPAAVGIDIVVTPPSGKSAYFMRSVVR